VIEFVLTPRNGIQGGCVSVAQDMLTNHNREASRFVAMVMNCHKSGTSLASQMFTESRSALDQHYIVVLCHLTYSMRKRKGLKLNTITLYIEKKKPPQTQVISQA
jgi:hypothetical protein